MRCTVILVPGDDAVSASVPAMPGCVSQGRTRAEALANARNAIAGWIATEAEQGRRHQGPKIRRDGSDRSAPPLRPSRRRDGRAGLACRATRKLSTALREAIAHGGPSLVDVVMESPLPLPTELTTAGGARNARWSG